MPPRPAPTWSFGAREGLLTMPTVLRHHGHDLVHLLDRQQPAAGPTVSGLAAALPSGRRRFRAHRGLGRIRRRRPRGIGRGLPQPGFQLADPLVQSDAKLVPALAPLVGGPLNLKQIRTHWAEILRLAASIQQGTVTASLMLR